MDGQRFKAEEAQSSTIAQFTTGVLGRSPENKRGHLKKGRNKRSIHPNGQRDLSSMSSTGDAALTSIFIRSSTRPHRPFDNSTPGEGGEKNGEHRNK